MPIINIGGGSPLLKFMLSILAIGVTTVYAVSAYEDYLARAYVAQGLVLARHAEQAVDEYFFMTGEFPSSREDAGVPELTGAGVDAVDILENGVIEVAFNNKVTEGEPRFLYLMPESNHGGSLVWTCSAKNPVYQTTVPPLESAKLPPNCRKV